MSAGGSRVREIPGSVRLGVRLGSCRYERACQLFNSARVSELIAQILAATCIDAIGLDMTVFGAPGRLVSWAKRRPQTRRSGKKTTAGSAGKGNPWLNVSWAGRSR
jgi:hypothetical protein